MIHRCGCEVPTRPHVEGGASVSEAQGIRQVGDLVIVSSSPTVRVALRTLMVWKTFLKRI